MGALGAFFKPFRAPLSSPWSNLGAILEAIHEKIPLKDWLARRHKSGENEHPSRSAKTSAPPASLSPRKEIVFPDGSEHPGSELPGCWLLDKSMKYDEVGGRRYEVV